MEKQGIVRRSTSPWASPLHLVRKANNEWRPCGDFRTLNNRTEPDHYPLPRLTDFTYKLAGKKFFSKIDLVMGYHQIPVYPSDVKKTAIVTPFGSWEFPRMLFGLKNSGATFQKLMHAIFSELPFVFTYIDDILVFSDTLEEHLVHLEKVFDKLKTNGLRARPDKCEFVKSKVVYLGYELSHEGLRPLPHRVEAIKKFVKPTTIKELQKYLGVLNFYHRFVKNLAEIVAPLTAALKGDAKDKLCWSDDMDSAFEHSKTALASASLLAFPVRGAEITVATDASSVAVGAVILQKVNNVVQPLVFYSRKLTDTEKNGLLSIGNC